MLLEEMFSTLPGCSAFTSSHSNVPSRSTLSSSSASPGRSSTDPIHASAAVISVVDATVRSDGGEEKDPPGPRFFFFCVSVSSESLLSLPAEAVTSEFSDESVASRTAGESALPSPSSSVPSSMSTAICPPAGIDELSVPVSPAIADARSANGSALGGSSSSSSSSSSCCCCCWSSAGCGSWPEPSALVPLISCTSRHAFAISSAFGSNPSRSSSLSTSAARSASVSTSSSANSSSTIGFTTPASLSQLPISRSGRAARGDCIGAAAAAVAAACSSAAIRATPHSVSLNASFALATKSALRANDFCAARSNAARRSAAGCILASSVVLTDTFTASLSCTAAKSSSARLYAAIAACKSELGSAPEA